MNRNKLSWSERYADQPVNPQQAALWQAQTQPPAPPAPNAGPGIRNPWIDSLPRRARGSRRGLVIFLLLLALLLGCLLYTSFKGSKASFALLSAARQPPRLFTCGLFCRQFQPPWIGL